MCAVQSVICEGDYTFAETVVSKIKRIAHLTDVQMLFVDGIFCSYYLNNYLQSREYINILGLFFGLGDACIKNLQEM